jgi:hypothetical protein
VAATLAALSQSERFEPPDESLAALARSTADLFDSAIADPTQKLYAVAAIGRLHLAVLQARVHQSSDRVTNDEDAVVNELLAYLRSPGCLGDASEDGSLQNSRRPVVGE